MKFVHISDLHIGKSLGNFKLIEDQRYILNQILDIAVGKNADGILIAGDIFDRANPPAEAFDLFDEFISNAEQKKIPLYVISGNHDSEIILGYGSGFFKKHNIFISSQLKDKIDVVELSDEYGKLNVYLMPYVQMSEVKQLLPDRIDEIKDYNDAVRLLLENSGIDYNQRNVILAHQFVIRNGEDPDIAGSESRAVKAVGTVEKIDSFLFNNFDYVALGHIHSPQELLRPEVRYSGSPLKYHVEEINQTKTIPIITLSEKGNVNIELVPLAPMRDMRMIKGKLRDILDSSVVTDTEDYIYAVLTDEIVEDNANGIIRLTYPNLIKMSVENSHTVNVGKNEIKDMEEEQTFEEIIKGLYKMIYGSEMNDDEIKVALETAQEVGI